MCSANIATQAGVAILISRIRVDDAATTTSAVHSAKPKRKALPRKDPKKRGLNERDLIWMFPS